MNEEDKVTRLTGFLPILLIYNDTKRIKEYVFESDFSYNDIIEALNLILEDKMLKKAYIERIRNIVEELNYRFMVNVAQDNPDFVSLREGMNELLYITGYEIGERKIRRKK